MFTVHSSCQVTTAKVFHAGTARNEAGELVAAGGRVLGVTALEADAAKVRAGLAYTIQQHMSCRHRRLRTRGSRRLYGKMHTIETTLAGEQWSGCQPDDVAKKISIKIR